MANETPVSARRAPSFSQASGRPGPRPRSDAGSFPPRWRFTAIRADPNTKIVEDPLGEFTDVVSFNEYIGWYVGLPDDCAKVKWVVKYNKPVLISEFGADALQGLHGDRLTRFTEEYQADLYRQTLPMLEKIPQLRGMTPWILCDFRSPRRALPQHPGRLEPQGPHRRKRHTKESVFRAEGFLRQESDGESLRPAFLKFTVPRAR